MQFEETRQASILLYSLGRVDILNHYLHPFALNEQHNCYVGIQALVTSAAKP